MIRFILIAILFLFIEFGAVGQMQHAVVADSLTHQPLPSISVFDRHGIAIGICDNSGRLPYISSDSYPITLRYLSYGDKEVQDASSDTIYMVETIAELPEIVVESGKHKLLHILAYVREFSTLNTYTDTVFLFREKMVDYMLNQEKKLKFKQWTSPRILNSKSYFRFTNNEGLDSVSDVSRYHFSWSDWMGIPPAMSLSAALDKIDCATDTVYAKCSPSEIWIKNYDRVMVDVDVLADTTGRKWVPRLSTFFQNNLDFEKFRARFSFDNILADSITPVDLNGYSYSIESNGRGHNMFMFNKVDEPFFVSTYAEVYVLDREYITVKEAKLWDKRNFSLEQVGIIEPKDAPELPKTIQELVTRVDAVNHDEVRLDVAPDHRMIRTTDGRRNFTLGGRILNVLKNLAGVSAYKHRRSMNNQWEDFRRSRVEKNHNDIQKLDSEQQKD